MRLIKEDFLNLSPPESKIKRTPVDGYSGLYCEQNQTGFTFQLKFKSPVTGKYRFLKLNRFKYDDVVNKKLLDIVIKQLVINQGAIAGGIDPLEVKKAGKQTDLPMQGKTVNKVFDAYISSNYFSQLSYSSQKHYLSNYRLHVAEKWGRVSVANIKRPDVLSFLNDIKSDSTHNNVLLIFQKIQSQAIDLGVINTPFAFNIKNRAAGTRSKILTDDEIISLMSSVAGLDSLRNICKFQLLTGCRVSEVAGARWSEFDMESKVWTIPPERIKTEKQYKKMTRSHCIPLMSKMAEILLNQRQYGTKGLVFPKAYNTTSRIEFYMPSAVGRWLKNEAGIEKGTHQLRRTVGTKIAEMDGMGEYDIKIILNHAVAGTTAKYVSTQQLERKREIYTKWHHYIDSLMTAEVAAYG